MTISKKKAETIWSDLRGNLLAAQDNISKIIATKAWEPLGYDTFTEAWTDRLGDLKLYGELRAVVVYAMFDEGATAADVTVSMSGVGPAVAKALKQAHDAGQDPKNLSARSRSAQRRDQTTHNPDKPRTVFVRMNADDYARLEKQAAATGQTVSDTARNIITARLHA